MTKKRKMVEGWLCGLKDMVAFIKTNPPKYFPDGDGYDHWSVPEPARRSQRVVWFTKQWKEIYNLKPPAPGRCFEVKIEL